MRTKALYLALVLSEALTLYKQTQGDSWNVDKPKKNGKDISRGGPHWNVSGGNAVCIEGNQGVGCRPPRVYLQGNWVLFAAVRLCWSSLHLPPCDMYTIL